MALEPDLLVDRARLKRRIVFWRVFAVVAVVIALIAAAGRGGGAGFALRPHIARLTVNGIITDDRAVTDQLAAAAIDPRVTALIVSIDSPGGSVSGGEGLHDAIAAVAARKPVVAVMRGEAASAGYMIAAPASRIFARQSTITGSIGVLMQTGEISSLLGKLGVTSTLIASGPLKGQPDPTQPMTPAAHDYLQGLVGDLYDQFVDIVAQGRHMDKAKVQALADGRAYTGRQALPLGLIDQYGGEHDARLWLARTRNVPLATPVVDLGKKPRFSAWMNTASFAGVADALMNIFVSQRVTLDGPVALWQPDR
jgi:protease-4